MLCRFVVSENGKYRIGCVVCCFLGGKGRNVSVYFCCYVGIRKLEGGVFLCEDLGGK